MTVSSNKRIEAKIFKRFRQYLWLAQLTFLKYQFADKRSRKIPMKYIEIIKNCKPQHGISMQGVCIFYSSNCSKVLIFS